MQAVNAIAPNQIIAVPPRAAAPSAARSSLLNIAPGCGVGHQPQVENHVGRRLTGRLGNGARAISGKDHGQKTRNRLPHVLRRAPILSGLDPEDIAALAAMTAWLREVPKGGALFAEGDEARGFFVCASGKLKVFKSAPDGREQILHFISPGETFAEVALFVGRAYPASAQALEASTVAFIPREGLFQLVKKRTDSPSSFSPARRSGCGG